MKKILITIIFISLFLSEEAFSGEQSPCPSFDKAKPFDEMAGVGLYATKEAWALGRVFQEPQGIKGKCFSYRVHSQRDDWQWLSPTSMLIFTYYNNYPGKYFIARVDFDGYEPLVLSSSWKAVLIGLEPYTYMAQRGPKTIHRLKIVRFYEAYGYKRESDGMIIKNLEDTDKAPKSKTPGDGGESWNLVFKEKKKKY